ncbi:hypothetical protein BAU15_05945 [Enterococcus sp. JM4C]|uniref:DUF975 family protein n=1 Tax=Candidatus Enterococcus huntleyi TaxID=1857217 RepID=UPI00137A5F27|nr:DUF975 family protein [Enterococcus sp. JM4C]KAF1297092.1 hypothetical protein BAU15_05945 [Enterococcus sp. JM4C]
MKISISEYKNRARNALAGQWGVNAGVIFVSFLTTSIVSSIVMSLSNFETDSIQQAGLDWIISACILFAFTYGCFYVSLFVSRGGRASIGQVFSIFQSKYYFPLLLINLIETVAQFIISAIIMIPVLLIAGASLYATILLTDNTNRAIQLRELGGMTIGISLGAIVVTLLLIIAVIVLSFLLSGVFRFVVLAKMDFPHLTITEALRYGWFLVKDRLGQYLLLQLSFIGWYILGTILFFVGVFWVNAYQNVTNAAFYDEARKQKGNPQEVSIGE